MDNLVVITKNITFGDLRSGNKMPIDVYEEQMKNWLFRPLEQLAQEKINSFENGYAILGLELLFFEPHGKYLSGNTIKKSGECFNCGFSPFLTYLEQNNLISNNTLEKIRNLDFYKISRCGIFHGMTIKSGLLIDSIHIEEKKVFYDSPIKSGILVSPWNFLEAQRNYFDNYVTDLRNNLTSDKYQKFMVTFNELFQY